MNTIVIPAYNEAENIKKVVNAVLEQGAIEVIISDDGSTDGTLDIARSLKKSENVRLVSGKNQGKGAAIKRGLEKARGGVLGFIDADMSAHPRELSKLFKEIDEGTDIAIGPRDLPESIIPVKQPRFRRLLGNGYRTLARLLFKIDVRDFQCGLKVFKREVWENINIDTDGFAFDTELIAKSHNMGYKLKEVPITWRDFPKSRVNPITDSVKMLFELIRIRYNLKKERAGVK
ncbi:MAG: glycosyltransferase [Candidatus Hydrothermarchaeaceae archaeon]